MEEHERDGWGRQDFPPWSVKRILFFGVIGLQIFSFFLSFLVGFIVGFVLSWVNVKFSLNLSNEAIVLITTLPSVAVSCAAVIAFIAFRLQKVSFSLRHVWMSHRMNVKEIGISLLVGFLMAVVLGGVYRAVIGEVPTYPMSSTQSDWWLAFFVDLMTLALMNPFMEEIVFRGLLYQSLRKRFSSFGAALSSALFFAIFHIDAITNLSILSLGFVFLLGIALAAMFERTRCLGNCISLHVSYNATMIAIHYACISPIR